MKSKSGYQHKTNNELSKMSRDALLKRLAELRSVLDYQSSIVKDVVLQLDVAKAAYEEAKDNMTAATKSLDEFMQQYKGGHGGDVQVQMEAARLKGIENFAYDTLHRAEQDLSEKRNNFGEMVDEGILMSKELDFINKLADESAVKETEKFDTAAIYEHTTNIN